MQLKNPVKMDKRTDLASLFCMIGRHGPAVAVAVIAMVSVVAGLIIYRTVRGKRRKAAAGAGDSGRRDASEPESEPNLEGTRNRVESTDLKEDDCLDIKEAEVTQRPYNLRNRRVAADKKASISPIIREPEKRLDTSPVLDFSSVAETSAEDDCKKDGVCSNEMAKDAEDHGCLTPVMTRDKEKVPSLQEVQVTCRDLFGKTSSREEDNQPVCPKHASLSQSQDDAQENQTSPETINMESSLEELIKYLDGVPISSKDADFKGIHHPDYIESSDHGLSSESKEESVPQYDYADDQLIALKHEVEHSAFEQTKVTSSQQNQHEDMMGKTMPGIHDGTGDAECSPTSEVIQEDIDEGPQEGLGSVSVNPHTLENTKQELRSQPENSLSFNEEVENSSEVLKTVLPCQNLFVDPEFVHFEAPSAAKTDFCALSTCLQPENVVKDAVAPVLVKNAGLDCLKLDVDGLESQSKTYSDVVFLKESGECMSLPCRAFETAVCENESSTASVSSAEIVYPGTSSFQSKESDQIEISEALSEVSVGPDMDEEIKPQQYHIQLLSCEPSESTWSSSGVGEESGISSMTVSPDLPDTDTEGNGGVLSVADRYPDSEEHTEAQGQFFADDDDAPADCNEDLEETVEHCQSPFSQQVSTEANDFSIANADVFAHEPKEVNLLTEQVFVGDVCLTELRESDVKPAVERVEEEDKTTEISIMEATMDNNEWITDGNIQVLPWMNLSVGPLPHSMPTDPVTSEHLGSATVDVPSSNTGSIMSIDVKPANALLDGNDKKIVLVQPMPQHVNVTFRIHYLTHSPYQKVAITGNQQELGNWKEFIPLEKAKDGHWSTVVSLPTESHVEWKFVVVDKGEVCRWEECGNRLLDTGYAENLLVHRWWGIL